MRVERHTPEEAPSGTRGFSLIELLIVVAIILVVASIAIPNYMRSKMAANEASAIHHLRTINTAQASFNSMYNIGYSGSLVRLGGPVGSATCTNAQLIDNVLGGADPANKSGYSFTITGGAAYAGVLPAGCVAGVVSYTVNANPLQCQTSGARTFFTDQSSVIRFNPGGAACAVAGIGDAPLQ